jgi:hypothetical protein
MNKSTLQASRYHGPWLWVLGLVGLDYFSTLAYQPSIAFQAAGRLAPVATVVVVLVTLLGALPIYLYIAARSPQGQGAIGLLERLVHGWRGKILVVVLLGFAATDFVFTRTLSVADAAVHLVHNPEPHWQRTLDTMFAAGNAARPWIDHPLWERVLRLWNRQMAVTLLLLALGFLFWAIFRRGFTKRIVHLAAIVVGVYLLLTAVIVGSGLYFLWQNPVIVDRWWENVSQGEWGLPASFPGYGWGIGAACVLLLPKMALGLSGFELSMVAMPLVGNESGVAAQSPTRRIRGTQALLVCAALIMVVYLLGSALVTTLLIPADEFKADGKAVNRALAYLAHADPIAGGERGNAINPVFGEAFGSLYDLSTVLILCLAGASVTIGLRDLVPPYLHRLGMEFQWAHAVGALLQIFNVVKLAVTIFFHADVSTQRGAYATSVLVLMMSAAAAGAVDLARSRRRIVALIGRWWFSLVGAVFGITAIAIVLGRPEGLLIALSLVVAVLIVSMISRVLRNTELRCEGFDFVDERSRFLWQSLEYLEFPVLVPHRPGLRGLDRKEAEIREWHRVGPEVPIVFLEVVLGDPSEFYQRPLIEVCEEKGRFIIRVSRCTSIPHAIAAVALELSKVGQPPELHFGWSEESPLTANLNFVLFGQGNVPWMVRELIRRAEPVAERQPRIVVG